MGIPQLMRGAFLAGVAGAVLLLEHTRRARGYVERPSTHAARNVAVAGLAAATAHALEAPAVVPLSRLAAGRKWGIVSQLPGPSWVRDLAAVILLDYTLYIWHILAHRVPWLWRFHLVHHVDLDLDASTGLRFHAGEIAASIPWRAAQVLAIGVTPRALMIWQSVTLASILFHHSNSRFDERTERILSWIVATPRMHAIHHSIEPAQLHSNFSSGLALWDRLHRTARFDADASEVTVGVLGHLDPACVTLPRILELPFSDRALPPGSHA